METVVDNILRRREFPKSEAIGSSGRMEIEMRSVDLILRLVGGDIREDRFGGGKDNQDGMYKQ